MASPLKSPTSVVTVPHLNGPAHQLVSAWTLHAVNTEVSPADPHRILRCPGPGGIVFGGDKPVARIQGSRHWSPQVDISQSKYDIARIVGNLTNLINVRQSIDPSDKFNIVRVPGSIRGRISDIFQPPIGGGVLERGSQTIQGPRFLFPPRVY